MKQWLAKWRPAHLLASWCTWWILMLVGIVAPGLPALWRVTRPGMHGSFNANFGDQGLSINVLQNTTTAWSVALSPTTLLLLVAVPPLVLFVLWLRAQRRRADRVEV
jgi:hypothetical protein